MQQLRSATQAVAPGRWVVGVSGGADSVALLYLLRHYRPDLELIVVHLDHQLRGDESDADRQFVIKLSANLRVKCEVDLLENHQLRSKYQCLNASSRYRAARLGMFGQVASKLNCAGVLTAHHADDQAETVLLRLLRGGESTSLCGIASVTRIGRLQVCRPLLQVRKVALRHYLESINASWREDSSNASLRYRRNVVRRWLADRPQLTEQLLRVGTAAAALRTWMDGQVAIIEQSTTSRASSTARTKTIQANNIPNEYRNRIVTRAIADASDPAARVLIRRWLRQEGVNTDLLRPRHLVAILSICRDRAIPGRINLPKGYRVTRSGEWLELSLLEPLG